MQKFTFSLMIFNDKMQRLLNFCSPAAVPTEWNVQLEIFLNFWTFIQILTHLVTVGKTVHMGLGLASLPTWS